MKLPLKSHDYKIKNESFDSFYYSLAAKSICISFIHDLRRLQDNEYLKVKVSIGLLNQIASVLKTFSYGLCESSGYELLWIVSKRSKDSDGLSISRELSNKIYNNAEDYVNGGLDIIICQILSFYSSKTNDSMILYKKNIRTAMNRFIKNNANAIELALNEWFLENSYKCVSKHARQIIQLSGDGSKIKVDDIMSFIIDRFFGNKTIIRSVGGEMKEETIGEYISSDKLFSKKLLRCVILDRCIKDSVLISIGKNAVISKINTSYRGQKTLKVPLSVIKNAIYNEYPILNTKKVSLNGKKYREFSINIKTIVNAVVKSLSDEYKVIDKGLNKFIVRNDYTAKDPIITTTDDTQKIEQEKALSFSEQRDKFRAQSKSYVNNGLKAPSVDLIKEEYIAETVNLESCRGLSAAMIEKLKSRGVQLKAISKPSISFEDRNAMVMFKETNDEYAELFS